MFKLVLRHVSRHNLYLQYLRLWFILNKHILIAKCMLQERVTLPRGLNMIRPKFPVDGRNTVVLLYL